MGTLGGGTMEGEPRICAHIPSGQLNDALMASIKAALIRINVTA